MKPSLSLRPGLALTMTPALQQAIRLLQLSSLDLQTEIRQALESNFMLEQVTGDEPAPDETDDEQRTESDDDAATAHTANTDEASVDVIADAAIPGDMPVDADWSDIYDGALMTNASGGAADSSLHDYLQANLHGDLSLRQHLEWQVGIAPLDETDSGIALALVDAVNEDGYLEDWDGICERLCGAPDIDPARVERVLDTVQGFEPAGIAARTICECLRLQLQQSPTTGSADALRLLEAPMEAIARRDVRLLANRTGLAVQAVSRALALIATLQPHPGRPWQANSADYVEPDVIVTRHHNRWRVTLNPEHTPRLRINPFYHRMVRRADTSIDQVSIKQHLQDARAFISGLAARNETLLRVAQRIVEEQRAFLDYGAEAMRPLVLHDISEPLEMHESTVSRATANKYLLTPRGLFELKHFFSSHVKTTHGGTCSATAIQAMIKRLIAQEIPGQPLSDSTLSRMLLDEGIQVARRTVAKYRENLRIPPSHERRIMA